MSSNTGNPTTPMPLTCGIDFGTSNSLAAVAGPNGITLCEVDPANADPHVLPSLLYFSRYGWERVGRAATHAYQTDPDGRFIRALKSALPEYTPEDRFKMFQKSYTLPGLLRKVFERLRERLEAQFGGPIRHATIGRPVRFSPDPNVDVRTEEMLREAATAAGFSSVRFLPEPEAATRYFFHSEGTRDNATVLVFDFGGGTLDLCVARWREGRYQVLATAGASIGGTLLDRILFEKKLLKHLGHGQKWGRGLDLPHALFNRLINPDANWRYSDAEYAYEARQILDASIAWGSASRQLQAFHEVVTRRLGPDLFGAIETAKVELSEVEETEIRYHSGKVEIAEPLSRQDLRVLFREQLQAIRDLIHTALRSAGLEPQQVDRVILAGGSSGLVCTQELLRELFGAERVPLRQDLFTSIAAGLALNAAGLDEVGRDIAY
jgi:hypothetical chaperone protein